MNINVLHCIFSDFIGKTHILSYSGYTNINHVLNVGVRMPRTHWPSSARSITHEEVILYVDMDSLRCIDFSKKEYIILLQSANVLFSKRNLLFSPEIDRHLLFGIEVEFELTYVGYDISQNRKCDQSVIISNLSLYLHDAGFICVIKKEVGENQYEINIGPGTARSVADDFVLCKFLLRRYAKKEGYIVSFLPYLGKKKESNSAHIHFSSLNFEENIAETGDFQKEFSSYFLNIVRDICILTCPNVNSFKRLLKRRIELGINVDIPALVDGRSQGWLRARNERTLEFRLPDPFMDVYPLLYIISTVVINSSRKDSIVVEDNIPAIPVSFEEAIFSSEIVNL